MLIELLFVLRSSPAIMKLWPEPSSTVVSARRVVSAGTLKLFRVTLPASDSSLTSGRTRIEMRPSARTIGVKARPTPYCLYSMVTAPSDCDTGWEFTASEKAGRFGPTGSRLGLRQDSDETVGLREIERTEKVKTEQLAGYATRWWRSNRC